MRSLKKLIAPAVAGFVLSFFISLIATKGNFGAALLRGILFAVIFAVLFFLIDFIFSKFLEGSSGSGASGKPSDPGLGSKVDITLSDEDLADDGDDLKFFVSHNKVGLNQDGNNSFEEPAPENQFGSDPVSVSSAEEKPAESKLQVPVSDKGSPSKPESKAAPASSGNPEKTFRPIQLGSGEEAAAAASAAPLDSDSEKVRDVDALPDISDFDSELGSENSSDGSSSDDGYLDDTDFTGPNASLYNRRKPSDDVTSGHDAETLAKAIQTILKKDE